MTGRECRRGKSNMFFSQSARESTRYRCCAGGCKYCSATRFAWRCVAKLERVQQSPCAFPYNHGSSLWVDRWNASRRVPIVWRPDKIRRNKAVNQVSQDVGWESSSAVQLTADKFRRWLLEHRLAKTPKRRYVFPWSHCGNFLLW